MQRSQENAPPLVALRILFFQTGRDQIQLRLRLLLRQVRLQPRHDVGSRIAAACPEAFCRETDGHRNIGFRPELEIRSSDTDYSEALIVERELFPDDAFIRAEPALPESVTQDRRRSGARMVVLRNKVAPKQGLDSQC